MNLNNIDTDNYLFISETTPEVAITLKEHIQMLISTL